MTDDERVAELESELAELRETVERQHYVIQYLAADADLDAVEATCPHCGEGEFVTDSGISWKRVQCHECGHSEYI
jgi:ribosomal protein S27AE